MKMKIHFNYKKFRNLGNRMRIKRINLRRNLNYSRLSCKQMIIINKYINS